MKGYKFIGYIKESYIKDFGIAKHLNKPIIQESGIYKHIYKHINEFKDIGSYEHTISNLKEIIENPYFVYYDEQKSSLHYYKFIDEYVCVIIKLTNKRNLFVTTVYPVSKNKIDKLETRH